MDRGRSRCGWRISEVEALLGLGRRDIQRACYGGRGGVAILDPADTAWGRRTYGEHDLAQLFLVGQLRRQGLSLPEIKAEFEDSRAAGRTVKDMLAVQAARLREQAEEVAGQLLQAEALLAALGGSEAPMEDVVAAHVRMQEALGATCEIPGHPVDGAAAREPSPLASLLGTPGLVDAPGMALAVDLWLGPGSSVAVREAADAAITRHDAIGENDDGKQ